MTYPSVFELSDLDGSNGFKINGEAARDGSGTSVAGAGDINGDGFADLIVGAPNAGPNGGASYVVFGKAGGFASNLELSALNGINGFQINCEAAGTRLLVDWHLANSVTTAANSTNTTELCTNQSSTSASRNILVDISMAGIGGRHFRPAERDADSSNCGGSYYLRDRQQLQRRQQSEQHQQRSCSSQWPEIHNF